MAAHNTQYKTVGVQWFARHWFPRHRFPRWIRTRSENPTVSYCQPLCVVQKNTTTHEKHSSDNDDFYINSDCLFTN